MDNRQNNIRNGACNNYNWNANSAFKKATADLSVSIGPISKTITPSNDPTKNAYRNCKNCDKHFNYHSKSDNKYKNSQINPFPSKK